MSPISAQLPQAVPNPAESASFWREQEMLLMREVLRLIGQSLTPSLVLREMLHLLSQLLGLNRGRIVLADRVAGDAPVSGTVQYSYGLTQAQISRGQYAAGEGITGGVLSNGRAAIVQDIDAEPAFLYRMVERSGLPPETVAFIAVPIISENKVMGVLACHRIRSRIRSLSDDVSIMSTLATLTGTLLQLTDSHQRRTAALRARNEMLERGIQSKHSRHGILGDSPALLKSLDQLERVASTSVAILLLGESGTGKELFARAVHKLSPRREQAFIKVNCAAIPETLFESELFGHERGAFTGANAARPGWFEQASGGTIFLDEIGEVPLAMQAKLLRVLQESVIVRLGGQSEKTIDVRVVAATHRQLDALVRAGQFRADLFYRLNVIPIELPALRERRSDIGLLAVQFATQANRAHQRQTQLTERALAALTAHDWPGNIRELSNVIERLVVLAHLPEIDEPEVLAVLGQNTCAPAKTIRLVQPTDVREYRLVNVSESERLLHALRNAGGNKSRAAQSLDMTARQYLYRLKKLQLKA
jgi:Nif-specific regulatory protein